MGHYFWQENETLSIIRSLNNDHLIKPIASFQYKGEQHGSFLFPWAKGGNLRELWATEETRPLHNKEMMCWVMKQLCGLCHALSILHETNHRHGDLKPENILLFDEGGYKGTLRIADVGLAKFHEPSTQERIDLNQASRTMTGTTRYVSPEFIHRKLAIPRVFDVWALGCVFLEFLIWTLYGNRVLQEFYRLNFLHFWEETAPAGFAVHSVIQPWINNMSQSLAETNTAVASLLDVIKTMMPVPNAVDRSESSAVYRSMCQIYERALEDDSYAFNSSVWDRVQMRAMQSHRSSGTSLNVPRSSLRAGAQLPQHEDSNTESQFPNIPIVIETPDDNNNARSGMTTASTSAQIAQEVSQPTHAVL